MAIPAPVNIVRCRGGLRAVAGLALLRSLGSFPLELKGRRIGRSGGLIESETVTPDIIWRGFPKEALP